MSEGRPAEYLISAVYFPSTGEAELTWEHLETGESVYLTVNLSPKDGEELARVVPPCVYYHADLAPGKERREDRRMIQELFEAMNAWPRDDENVVLQVFGKDGVYLGEHEFRAYAPISKSKFNEDLLIWHKGYPSLYLRYLPNGEGKRHYKNHSCVVIDDEAIQMTLWRDAPYDLVVCSYHPVEQYAPLLPPKPGPVYPVRRLRQ